MRDQLLNLRLVEEIHADTYAGTKAEQKGIFYFSDKAVRNV